MLATLLLVAPSFQLPVPKGPDARPVRIEVVLPDGSRVPSGVPGLHVGVEALIEDSMGEPARVDCWNFTYEAEARILPAQVGSCLHMAVSYPPHPVAERSIVVQPGGPDAEEQLCVVQLGEPVPMRRLQVELELPGGAPDYSEYLWELRTIGTGTPFLHAGWGRSPSAMGVPAGLYELVVSGQYSMMCGNSPPFTGEFVPYRTWVDLRAADQVVVVKPARGVELKILAAWDGPIPVTPYVYGDLFVPSPTFWANGDGEQGWARPQLISIATGLEVEALWGWHQLAWPFGQHGIPNGLEVFGLDRVPAGTYELRLEGVGIEAFAQRVTILDQGTQLVELAPHRRE